MIDWHSLLDYRESRVPCPECGRGPKDRTCGVTIEPDGRGVAHCFRCEYVETFRPEGATVLRAGRDTRPTVKHDVLSEYGAEIWTECQPVHGTGCAYLRARRCVIPPDDGDLRFHPALKHSPTGYVGPALVALVTDALSRVPLTLHRTWIQENGEKAPIEPARMLLGGHRKSGGVIRLWPDEAVTHGLAVTEGLETALSLAHAHQPVWSVIDAGNLAQFPVLPGIESLLIGVDHDPAGLDAAEACASRWADAGREVHLVIPGEIKTDINDLARAA